MNLYTSQQMKKCMTMVNAKPVVLYR